MCAPGFKEALIKRITLPDEQPHTLETIIEYLYTDNIWAKGYPRPGASAQDKALELAELYVTADKYGLNAMKDTIVSKLKLYTAVNEISDWLDVAHTIYVSEPSAEEPYPSYLRSLVVKLLGCPDNPVIDVHNILEGCIKSGGRLALDIHQAYKEFWSNKTSHEVSMATDPDEVLLGNEYGLPRRRQTIRSPAIANMNDMSAFLTRQHGPPSRPRRPRYMGHVFNTQDNQGRSLI
ncbi:MAG: hypothetical protein Q9166_005901 [cf. Caloplaca sp. 2 TL-2023]